VYLKPEFVEAAFNRFGKRVISRAKANLTRDKRRISDALYKSLTYDVKVSQRGSIEFTISMAEHGEYQDLGVRGVKGTKNKFTKRSPFKYKSKMPPVGKIDRWVVKKGIAPRDESGRFATRRGLSFAIAKNIFEFGIPQSLFFTKPFESAFADLPDSIIEAYALDVEKFLNSVIDGG